MPCVGPQRPYSLVKEFCILPKKSPIFYQQRPVHCLKRPGLYSHMWHDSFMRRDSFTYVTWLIHVWRDAFVCDVCAGVFDVSCSTCDMTCSQIHMWHDSFINDMTNSYVTWFVHMWHDSFICDMTHSYVTWLMRRDIRCALPHHQNASRDPPPSLA